MTAALPYITFHVWLGLLFAGLFFLVCLYFWDREDRKWRGGGR